MAPDEITPLRPQVHDGGDVMVGPYRLIKQIGAGSIGRVFLAEHTRLGRLVALKMIRSRYARDRNVVSRFLGEARAVNRIHHENVVEVTDFLESSDGKSCYVMELLEGQSLADLLARRRVLPMSRAIHIGKQIASALRAVHAEGIVHRDVKPGNIFLVERPGEQDLVKLLDFGVAKLSSLGDESLRHRTTTGSVLGTPEYMAPEQTLGMDIGTAADSYSFGIVLFELLTGRRPFSGSTVAELFDQQRSTPAPRLDRVALGEPPPPKLVELVDRCLAKDATQRPRMADAETLLLDLEQSSWKRPRWIPPAIAACAAATLAVALGTVLFRAKPRSVEVVHVPLVQPAAIAEPEIRRTVVLEFTSIPSGAEVSTEGQPLGKTPLRFEVARSERSIPFELRLDGHASAAREIAPVRDSYVMVHLAEEPKIARRPKPRARKQDKPEVPPEGPIDRAEIRDPFAEGTR